MRRVHPQRAKPSAQSSNTNNNPSSGGVDNTSVNHEVKPWTTHSELHKRYTADNNDTTLDQAVSHARLSSISNLSATTTAKKPFMFSSSSMMRHSQEHEPDATNLRQNGKLSLTNRSKDKNNSNSGDGGTGGQDRGGVGNRPSIVIGNDDDDDDDDFELPSIDDLFTDVLPRKFRRVDSSTDSDTTSDRTHTHQPQIKGKTPLHKHSHSDMRKGKQVVVSEEDQWLMSEFQVDEDIDLFSLSPSSKTDNQPIQRMPSTMSIRSVVSQTHRTLNEIDQLFMDESLTHSPSTRLQTPFGDQRLSEQGSSTRHVRATVIYSPDHDMNEPGADEVVLFEDLPPEDQDVTSGGDSQVLGQRKEGEKAHDEPRDELGVGQSATVSDEQATSTIEQATEESSSRKETQTFTLPHSSDAFKDRLTKLGGVFQSSMDEMMDAILEVEQLRTSVEKTLTDRQEFLNHRGERVHQQARQLQEEASSLHSKTRDNMLRAVHDE
ncbi:hypothetical protein EC957_008490 [Mortierella hygrophila]|uniref:Uncharacterized protein n=1 Tax=Mortierella hygrophila TaxID=979708 RepID=A0A9P6EXI7_9FUNG|nr:hypothetical protein EC957_008490 [Mortierella hygrophila]